MCGIAGELRFDNSESDIAVTKTMCDAQIHRGPDDDGYFSNGPISLGIRRLSIIDLTKGLYPIQNEEGNIHLVFNGEIYGFHSLRDELEGLGHKFRSKTDAETVVHSFEEWGTDCLNRLNGMFAIAIWDELKQLLWLARDHFGIKPLYYYRDSKFFLFASEIKPLLTHPGIARKPNEDVIQRYMKTGLVENGDESFFRGIYRVPPAHHLVIRPDGSLNLAAYWAPRVSRELDGETEDGEIAETRRLFLEAVQRQLVSDVPVGTCLSGGLDSSSVVTAVEKIHPSRNIKTFSAVFPGDPVDESRYAKLVCESAKAQYNPVTPTANELWDDLPTLVKCQEEPFIDLAIYPQWRVMKQASESGIRVMLDGQGSDELLAGYHFYHLFYILTLIRKWKLRRALVEAWRSRDKTFPWLRERYMKAILRDVHHGTVSGPVRKHLDDLASILENDTSKTSLPVLLRYEDKSSMWHSVEARVPFLDKPFFEYVAMLPLDRKIHDGWSKYVLRLATKGILPDEVRLRRDKKAFDTPTEWVDELRPRLIQFFEDSSSLRATMFYDLQIVRQILEGSELSRHEMSLVWRAIILELWYREFF